MLGARALQALPPPLRRAGTLLRLAAETPEQFFQSFGRNLDDWARGSLFSANFRSRVRNHDPIAHYRAALARTAATRAVDQVMEAQMQTLLQDDYLAKADIGTMAASLEGRAPLLDVDLVDLATRIPARVRFRGHQPKGLLRVLARRHVPAAAIDRQKQGFVAPVGGWLRGPWRDLIDDVVLGPSIERRGWFDRKAVEATVSSQRNGQGHDYVVWTLLVLELWLRATLDTPASAAPWRRVRPAEVFST
jgi:asparagine synthase (glutamine-hydrolysing)